MLQMVQEPPGSSFETPRAAAPQDEGLLGDDGIGDFEP
jgi:hypothetical protein